jgi:ABC-type Na+ transport system ATPase subunit NatA/cell division protein FtsL
MVLNIVFLTDVLPIFLKYLIMIFPFISFSANLLCFFDFNNFKEISFEFLFFNNSSGINFFTINLLSLIYSIILLLIAIYLIKKKVNDKNFFDLFKLNFNEKENNNNNYINLKIEEIKNNIIENENEEKIPKNKQEFIEIHHEELTNINKNYLSENNCLKIKNITKTFNDLIAVNNVSLNLFPSEIFVLLGHNGAGKTTLIKLISGLEIQNSGEIYLNGINLKNNLEYLYKNIGLCHQENIFFDYLTVKEHLYYLSLIKGSNNLEEINNLLENLQMKNKENSIIKTLSGGQMRKLAVALSLVGDRKLILLDEPTSGVDIVTRRELWNFLKNYKKNKIIVLTTHSLEEAEFLADRIGIML